jgi:hypothetical protein
MSTVKWSVVPIWDLILKDILKTYADDTIFFLVPMIQASNMPFWHPYLEIWLMRLSDYSKPEKKLLTTNLSAPYFIRCWKHSTKCVINTNNLPRYYSLTKICFVLANDQICWLNAQIILIAIVPWKRRSISRNSTDLLSMVARRNGSS